MLKVEDEHAKHWPVYEVIERWSQLFKGHVLIERYRNGELKSKAEYSAVSELVELYRIRLMDIS